MMGIADKFDENGNDLKGVIPKSVRHIFGFIDDNPNSGKKFLIRCAYLEIYNEQILDLLSKFGADGGKQKKGGARPGEQKEKSLQIKEDPDRGIYVQDLT